MENKKLFELAKEVRKNARCSLSGYMVGAALLAKNGKVYVGCNVEMNEIMGLSNCAERVALQSAIADGQSDFVKILVVGGLKDDKLVITPPCGVCRQYMAEICPDIKVVLTTDGIEFVEYNLLELLPQTFTLK